MPTSWLSILYGPVEATAAWYCRPLSLACGTGADCGLLTRKSNSENGAFSLKTIVESSGVSMPVKSSRFLSLYGPA